MKKSKGKLGSMSAGVQSGLSEAQRFSPDASSPGYNSTNQRPKNDGPSGRKNTSVSNAKG